MNCLKLGFIRPVFAFVASLLLASSCPALGQENAAGLSPAVAAATYAPLYAYSSVFGTGADGAVTISSGTTTLSRDMHFTNLTVNGTGVIKPNGWRIYVSGTLDISAAGAGAIAFNSSTNSPGPSGATCGSPFGGGVGTNSLPASGYGNYGANGATGVGAATGAVGQVIYQIGGNGGVGGAGGAGVSAGGTAGTVAAPANQLYQLDGFYQRYMGGASGVTPSVVTASYGGSGGGGGGGDGTNSGAGGGASQNPPGMVWIAARFIQRGTNTTAGIIQAINVSPAQTGGAATAGNTGGGGGGGGAPGGVVSILAESLLGTQIPNAVNVSATAGGPGGVGFGTGKGGSGGYGGGQGLYQLTLLSAGTYTRVVQPNAPATTTAASGTGTTATITFAPAGLTLTVGNPITVSGMTPSGYNVVGAIITAAAAGSVSYANSTTGAQTVAGTIAYTAGGTTTTTTGGTAGTAGYGFGAL